MKKVVVLVMALMMTIGMLIVSKGGSVFAETIELKLAHFMPTMHVQHQMAFEPFAKQVAKLTDGKVNVKIYPGATLANPKTMVDAITTGITDIGFVLPEYIPGRFQRSSVMELPFIFSSATHVAETVYAIYDEYLSEDYKRFKVLWFLSAPLTQLHTVNKAVLTVDDLKGMKIRSASATETSGLRLLGANPIGMPISELAIALQKGVVDGAFTPYAALNSHKLIDIVKHITEINYNGALMCVLMNKDTWQGLPGFAKKAIDQVANKSFGIRAAGAFDEEDAENIKMGMAKGIEFHKFSDAEKANIREKLKNIWQEWVDEKGKRFPAQKLLDATLAAAESTQ